MELTLDIYLARPRRGNFEASVPWGGPLAEPIGGPSPAELREQIMFRAADMLTGEQRERPLEALITPDELEFRRIVVHRPAADSGPSSEKKSVSTHAIVGRWSGESIWHLWLPCVGDVCLPLEEPSSEHIQRAVDAWAKRVTDATILDRLKAEYPGKLSSVTLDLETVSDGAQDSGEADRLRQPETLREVADNLVHQADDDRLGRAWGRDDTVDGLVDLLTGTEAAHVCLVGPPGAGKSAVVDEAVQRTRSLQETYRHRRDVWRTSGDRLIAGMSRVGQWEDRTRRVCRELTARGDVLVIGDLLGLIRAGRPRQGGAGVARFLEPHIHQGDFSLIIEATERTFDLARAEAPGFVEALRRVPVDGMTEDEALAVVNAQARSIESEHPVQFEPDGIESVLRLARRYYRREVFPGKAVRLMRHCLNEALKRRAGGHRSASHSVNDDGAITIGADDVASVIQGRTDLPMRVLRPEKGRSAEAVRESFQSRVFDQPEATDVITDLVVAIEQGMCDPRQPLGSLLLIGPSGVGKTETAKALAEEAFGSEERLIRFDMSEFAEPAAASRLIGTPSDPDGELTSRVRARPYSVLLFDEIEKAHTAALDLLLQILGDGRLTDASGQTVDFTNTVVAMTSNLGAGEEDRWVGFKGGDAERDREERNLHYRRAAESFFRPEMFNRIGRIVPFQPLGLETLRRIARRTLRELMDRRGLRQPQIMVDVAPDLVEHLVGDAVDDRYGARTLGNRIERTLIAPLARQLTRRPDDGLTRVTIRPGTDDTLSLDLQSLDNAPARQAPLPPGVDDLAPRPDILTPALEGLIDAVEALSDSAAFRNLEDERQTLLEAINAQEDDDAEALDTGERLRQRELVRGSMDQLVDRTRDLLDDDGTLPDLSDQVRSEIHRWSREYGALARDFTWVRAQIAALQRRSIDGGTLVFSSLSGPAHRLVKHWWRWMSAWANERGVELTTAIHRSHEWEPMTVSEPESQPDLSGIAFSGEHPALSLLFERLAGYTFAPQPPTHGRHALALTRFDPEGTADPAHLSERLNRGDDSMPEAPGARVEFRLDDGALVDLRLGKTFHPPSGADAIREFADRLACGRIALHLEALAPDLPELPATREEAP